MVLKFFKLIVKTFFREVTVRGLKNLPDSGPAIFTPNHPNALIDPLLLFFLPSTYRIRFVAKAPLFRIALLGWIMARMRAIPVVRRFEADGKVDYKAFFASCVNSLAAGESIAIFPEGVSLPQPHLATLRSGAARLFFLAREKGLDVPIIPVGLNYEHGSIFRSSVVIWIAPPLYTADLIHMHSQSPQTAVRGLTERIGQTLNEHVFQAANFRDRELMLLLEKIYHEEKDDGSWLQRLERLKQFEKGLNLLRNCCSSDIERLRQMLARYEKLYQAYKEMHAPRFPDRWPMAVIGFPLAGLGWLLTIIPYNLCNLIVKHIKRYDAAAAATYKVVYSLFLFPLAFLLESLLVHLWLGRAASIIFAIGIIPLSYFTLYFFEDLYAVDRGVPVSSEKLRKPLQNRISKKLEMQRAHINDLINELAAKIDSESKTLEPHQEGNHYHRKK